MIATARAAANRVGLVGGRDVSLLRRILILTGFCVAQILDVTTTHIGLAQGRQELNGIAAWIIARDGEMTVYLLKLGLVAALVAFLLLFGRRRAGVWNAYLIAAWITTFAVLNNLYRILS